MQQSAQATLQNLIGAKRAKAGNSSKKPKAAAPKRDKVSNGILKADTHGQVFTPEALVKQMLALRKQDGRVLEPSCGSGAFAKPLHEADAKLVALELDAEHAPAYATVQDFFDYPVTEQFETVIGNPPYVRYQDISAGTKQKLDKSGFDGRTNLFYFFIKKCVQHLKPGGELIFIVPREFPKATAARHLNRWLFEQGTITDFYETGDKTVFIGATPPCCVFRFQKGLMDRTMADGRVFAEHNGQLFFLPAGTSGVPLSEFFTVAVGGISGADRLFKHAKGKVEVVCSSTRKNGQTRRMLHGTHARLMLCKHKEKLLNRGVRRFTEANWWEWGREWKQSTAPRLYVNAKTRQASPFFTHDATAYDGSIFALFPKQPGMDIEQAAATLNAVDWNALGFMAGNRFLFAQRALEQALIPDTVATQLRAAIVPPIFQLAA